ncbi:MAG: DUF2393 family protein [Terracidiphilus sp.]|nr:DUF2393 family protein [Terracidiphilus sp.]
MSTGPNLNLTSHEEKLERNWLPLAIAAGVVVVVAAVVILTLQHGRKGPVVTPISAAPDAYAASLPISGLVMSESSNLAGGKVTYVDGMIANTGNRTVSGITVQVLFRNYAKEVTQNETQRMQWIRTRDPYVDTEPVSAAPLAPQQSQQFRLIFDGVKPDWDGAYPEIRVMQVDFK